MSKVTMPRLLAQSKLTIEEYQRAKQSKHFHEWDWSWSSSQNVYLKAMYYYRPIPHYNGNVLKCAGHGAERPEHRAFYEPFFATNEDGQFMPGVVIVEGYRGDRITTDLKEFTDCSIAHMGSIQF
jgi:hypothetical protein